MPSETQAKPSVDPRVEAVSALLDRPAQAFRSALAVTMEEVRRIVESSRPAPDSGTSGVDQRQVALGAFANQYMQPERFVAFQSDAEESDQVAQRRLEAVLTTLEGVAHEARSAALVEVGPGRGLFTAVDQALNKIGRAFGAARVVNLTRAQSYDEAEHAGLMTGFPHRSWGAVERAVAPPLIVCGEGSELRAADLAGFLDGHQKIVLLVGGQVDPALLARLITPGTFVQQAAEAAELKRFAAFDGPGVAALVAAPAALFMHDPQAGATPAERLTIHCMPRPEGVRPPGGALGGMSAAWLRDGVQHLASLVSPSGQDTPAAGEDGAAPPAAGDQPEAPIDKLAAWLVNQTDLSNA